MNVDMSVGVRCKGLSVWVGVCVWTRARGSVATRVVLCVGVEYAYVVWGEGVWGV